MAKIIATELKEVPDYKRISDIKGQQGIPEDRDIIQISERGIERRGDADLTDPQGIYTDVPRYIRGVRNVARMMQEIALLKLMLPDEMNILTDHPEYTFVLWENYTLGSSYDPVRSHVLVNIPDEYPRIPPGLGPKDGIYLVGGLRRNNQPLECGRDQYHWDCYHNPSDMKEKGWAWWCFADLNSWDPYRDNLLKVAVVLAETLQNPDKQRFG